MGRASNQAYLRLELVHVCSFLVPIAGRGTFSALEVPRLPMLVAVLKLLVHCVFNVFCNNCSANGASLPPTEHALGCMSARRPVIFRDISSSGFAWAVLGRPFLIQFRILWPCLAANAHSHSLSPPLAAHCRLPRGHIALYVFFECIAHVFPWLFSVAFQLLTCRPASERFGWYQFRKFTFICIFSCVRVSLVQVLLWQGQQSLNSLSHISCRSPCQKWSL